MVMEILTGSGGGGFHPICKIYWGDSVLVNKKEWGGFCPGGGGFCPTLTLDVIKR